ncbi:MAG: hypothetical protein ACRECI_13680 [Methyloceanibacter sp.]
MSLLQELGLEHEQRVGKAEFQKLLGCADTTLERLERDDPDFPAAVRVRSKPTWTLAQIFDYIEIRRIKTEAEREALRDKKRREYRRRNRRD